MAAGQTACGQTAGALDEAEPDAEGLTLVGDVMALAWRKHGLNEQTAELDGLEAALHERYVAMLREPENDAVAE